MAGPPGCRPRRRAARTPVRRRVAGALAGAALVACVGTPALGEGEAPAVEPRAKELVVSMAAALAGLRSVRVDSEYALDVVLETGQKLQYGGVTTTWLQRPNQLRTERTGERVQTVFVYDGEQAVLHVMPEDFYATKEAPGTLDEFLDFALERLEIAPAGLDLLYSDGGAGLLDGVTSGLYVGRTRVAGRDCHHVAFRAPDVDWQLWIEDGETALPCRYVITTLDVQNAPEMSVTFLRWEPGADVSGRFEFRPPESARRIEFAAPAEPPAEEGASR